MRWTIMRTKPLTAGMLRQLRKSCSWRDGLILQISYDTGLRISDILSMTSESIAKEMTVKEQKTGKSRKIKISNTTLADLKRYIKAFHRKPQEQIFQVTRQTVFRNIKRQCGFLGHKYDNISAHSARKAYAIRYCKKNGLLATQKEMQHSNLATTALYVGGWEN